MTLTAVRGRASVAVRQRDNYRDEVHALRAEAREIGTLLPDARALYVYVAVDGNRVIEQKAARIVYLVGRAHRRYGGGRAAWGASPPCCCSPSPAPWPSLPAASCAGA